MVLKCNTESKMEYTIWKSNENWTKEWCQIVCSILFEFYCMTSGVCQKWNENGMYSIEMFASRSRWLLWRSTVRVRPLPGNLNRLSWLIWTSRLCLTLQARSRLGLQTTRSRSCGSHQGTTRSSSEATPSDGARAYQTSTPNWWRTTKDTSSSQN